MNLYYQRLLRRSTPSSPLRSSHLTSRSPTWFRHASTQPPTSRLARIESRLPRFLARYLTPLRNAPISHITAFLVLHEITAIVPLFGLAGFFHYTDWLPPYISEGAWVKEGMDRFGRYARKKGWISSAEEGEVTAGARWYGRGEGGVRIVVE